MAGLPRLQRIVVSAGVALAGAVILSAQAAPQTPRSPADPLLEEVRSLRADVNRAASVSVRAQLLVARLQLQDQRVSVTFGQLSEVRRQMTNIESGIAPANSEMQQLDQYLREPTLLEPQRRAAEDHIARLKDQLDQIQQELQRLRAQEGDLAAQLATEQGRWAEFNSRLDELERQLGGR
jgi:predicted  nucleic acid-binding Zn-ribbon protein